LKLKVLLAIGLIATVLLAPHVIRGADTRLPVYYWQIGDVISPLPSYNPQKNLDCDDITLYTYYWLTNYGYGVDKLVIMYGSLDTTGETQWQSDHYWVNVYSGDQIYSYDLGYCFQDEQHLEGYEVPLKQLLQEATRDLLGR
jgi:hypothetical protein